MEIDANLFEGKFTGPFEVGKSDVSYGGRHVFVVVADVKGASISETKDGDDKLTFTMKPVDVAVVRSQERSEGLIRDFNLSGLPPGLFSLEEGVADDALERILEEA